MLPRTSPTNNRSLPGQRVIRSGCLNCALGNTRTDLYFGGGSGEPTTFDVVHGFRFSADLSSAARVDQSTERSVSAAANPTVTAASRVKVRGVMRSPQAEC